MAPKKNRKQAQETMLEEPVKDRVVPSSSTSALEHSWTLFGFNKELGGASQSIIMLKILVLKS
jgi:hypothetical protein